MSFDIRDFMEEIGTAKFKGDNWIPELSNLSVNSFFTVGETYPVYDFEGIICVIGSNNKEYKFVPGSWSKIKYKK